MRRLIRLARVLKLVVALLSLTAYLPTVATAHTCGSNWCSGSDSNSATNIQGNGPQVYIGETGTYCDDFYGCSGVAWSNTGASNAASRYSAGTGIGVEDYYFAGGPGKAPSGYSAYCFGAKQGYWVTYHMVVNHNSYLWAQYLTFIDVEDPIADYGWNNAYNDRQVFNGFTDYVAGKNPCGYGANSQDVSQYGAYSSPSAWGGAMGSYGYIPNTYVWTYESTCHDYWPGSNWGSLAQWWGSSGYNWALQFEQTSCGPADWNDAYEPDYLPVLGIPLGN